MNNKKLNIVLILALVILSGIVIYQNFIASDTDEHVLTENAEGEQLYTCGMHPDIITTEPGNCPICGMKLTPVKDSNTSSGEKEILYWVAPMDPNEIYDSPGKSKMGMDLVPVYSDESAQAGVVTIDPSVQQNMNVKFTKVKEKVLTPTIETNATISVDERKETQITSRVSGWVEKLFINYTGQQVGKGEKLLEIYSPELVSAQQEYLTAIKYKNKVADDKLASSGDELVENAYRKLTLLNLSPSEIFELENNNEVKTTVPLYSPVTGTVLMKKVTEGEKINTGANLLHIADLSNLWVKADIYESEINNVKVGQKVQVYVNAYPGETFNGKVAFIYPTIDPKTRTSQIRIDIPNLNGKLKPSMLANVTIHANESKSLPVVDESAIIRSGQQNVAVQYLGNGKFKPVRVDLGEFADGQYQIISGLKPGDKVVTSAQFLIDSESSLKSAMRNFSNAEPMDMEENDISESALIRKGKIDLQAIDENNDGKVFQDPMDWNVISDEPGKCPICEMTLVEVSLKEARKNLIDNGYEAKELSSMNMKSNKNKDNKTTHQHSTKKSEENSQSNLVRTGKIDLTAIDKNGDSKLFECPMDWNVLADEYQRCPLCEMKMKEYTIDEVKTNLEKYGYEYK